MLSTRFPQRRLQRHIYQLYDEVDFWKRTYEQWDRNETDEQRAFLYARRATALDELRLALLHARDLVADIPRLS